MTQQVHLSKSRYTLFRQCPKALWLNNYKPDVAVIDDATKARFEAGNVVGDLAMEYLDLYEEVTVFRPDGFLDLAEMIRRTQDAMARGVENITEASFSWDGNYCAVDILHKTPGGWAIYEVKSSSGSIDMPENDADYVKYARDIAYQKYILEQCGVKVTGTYLVRIDKEYVRGDELDIKSLFYTADLRELVQQEYQVVPQMIAAAKKTLAGDEPNVDLGLRCHDPYNCAFWKYCTKALPIPSVFDVYGGMGRGGFSFMKKLGYYSQGLITFDDLRNENLGAIQNMQIECTLQDKDSINPKGISRFLNKLSFPLYFLDFETQQDVIPQYPGTKPYQQVPFQYSLHYIETEGGTLFHKEFLGVSGQDPRRAIAESLCRDIPRNVCTLAYNKAFECGRLRELADAFPDLAEHLRNIADNIQDLIDPFRAGDYYVPAMHGSFSIKKVLPALFPNNPELDYKSLDDTCQNGTQAMNLFPSIVHMTPAEATAAREALLRYCELDTFAMVKVWEKLLDKSGQANVKHYTLADTVRV